MKRFLSAVCLCLCLLTLGLFFLLPGGRAQNNVLANLLSYPAPPPPNPLTANSVRNEKFFAKNNAPQDDAPIDDLMDYWEAQNQYDQKYVYTVKPSDKTLERILGEIEKNPEQLPQFLNVLSHLPGAADTVKRLYDRELSNRDYGEEWRSGVKDWLKYNSRYFASELAEEARAAEDTGEYLTNQNEVLALARVDWDSARPLLDKMYNSPNQPILQTLARWAFYEHALREGDTSDVDRYRKELQETVENKQAKPGNRDLAMDALVESGDFPGRDDWYYTLLEDETLFDLRVNGAAYTSLTTLLNHSPPEKYREKMLELVKSGNQNIRNVAARNLGTLLDDRDPEVIRALLPWLENPNWAVEVAGERQLLVQALASVQMPESVPGLIAVLNEAKKTEITNDEPSIVAGNTTMTNSIPVLRNTTANTVSTRIEYPLRYSAVGALTIQRDARAAPALRALLPQVDEYQRSSVVQALLVSRGYSVPEQIDALESVSKSTIQLSGNTNAVVGNYTGDATVTNANTYVIRGDDPNDMKAVLGRLIISNTEPDGDFVMALIDRIGVLETKDPQLAANLRAVMMNWRGAAINSLFLRDLKTGKGNSDTIVKLLSVRKELREKQINEINELRSGANPVSYGISACLLEDAGDYDAILSGDNADGKIALLGCARLIRAPLNLQSVAQYLKNPNQLLARAAELYLETEDSPAARQMILAVHPDEAKILGARTSFSDGESSIYSNYTGELFTSVNEAFSAYPEYYFQGGYYEELDDAQKLLQQEVKENQELLGVYAYNDSYIRIYRDKAVLSWTENEARYRERDLSREEFDNFKYYLAAQRVDELSPFLAMCQECKERELLMLGRGGGRRIFVKAERMPPFFAQLDEMFEEMRKPPAKLHYWLEKSVPGLEILFTDEALQARAVWKTGEDFRVLLDDVERRKRIDKELDLQDEKDAENSEQDYEQYEKISAKRREQRKYENFSWFKFDRARPGDSVAQPPQFEFLPARDSFPAQAETGQWKAHTANFEIRADQQGLYKLSRGVFTKIRSGSYQKPVVTPNGRWAIVTKFDEEGSSASYRVNLLTNREFKIALPDYGLVEPAAFVPSLNKVLLYAGSYYEEESEIDGTYFLLDAETGVVQPVKGEATPLVQQTYRPLQPAASPDEFWAAIPDRGEKKTAFGIYNAKTMSFKPLLSFPRILFNSMNMWVDGGKIYFVYEGHLLSVPLPKPPAG